MQSAHLWWADQAKTLPCLAALKHQDTCNALSQRTLACLALCAALGARFTDLIPFNQSTNHTMAPLPDVTIVFVGVADSATLPAKLGRDTCRSVSKAIKQCMLQQLQALPGGDGYLCHKLEAEFRFMLAFEQPHKAMQWCLLMQVSTGWCMVGVFLTLPKRAVELLPCPVLPGMLLSNSATSLDQTCPALMH